MYRKLLIIVTSLLLAFPVLAQQAPDQIIANSEDWRDVYSVMLYGSLTGQQTNFLVSNRHAPLILNAIPRESHVWSISSSVVPYVVGYSNIIQSRGMTAEEFVYENTNLELANQVDVVNYIVVDDSYGYNAISVAPYAVATDAYVLFADAENIDDIEDYLNTVDVEKITIYGHVDREVLDSLQLYDPEIINEDGDRFLNNIEIVKRFQEINPAKQTVLTNGEFIEKEIMSGTEPVIFIGSNNVPDVVREYVQDSDIEVGVLIGNELVSTATFIRRQIGISVFVKFAQGARAPRGAISQVEALDMFYLPIYNINLEIASIKYNRATNQLEISIRNTEDLAAYFTGSYTIRASDGSSRTVGDLEPVFIDGNEIKTMVYDVETLPEGSITADVFVIYGESKFSLEKEIRGTLEIEVVRVLDECEISTDEQEINLILNPRSKLFHADIENIGEVECFVDAELVDLSIAGERRSFGSDKVVSISPGSEKKIRIRVPEWEEDDLEDNEEVTLRLFYGEREDSLVKVFEGRFALTVKGADYLFYTLLLIILALVFLIIWKRRKKGKERAEFKTQ